MFDELNLEEIEITPFELDDNQYIKLEENIEKTIQIKFYDMLK